MIGALAAALATAKAPGRTFHTRAQSLEAPSRVAGGPPLINLPLTRQKRSNERNERGTKKKD
jgi:hypothetical protein